MKIIAEYKAGSFSYGLNNENSDIDYRYLFLNTEVPRILGTERFEHVDNINKVEDRFGFELVNFLKLMNRSNSQCYEMIFNENWITKSPEFDLIQKNREKLFNSENLFKCLRGYAESEKRQIFGVDTGKLGEKRKKAIETYGYSFRNASHAIRLLRCGIIFFRYDYYPVNIFEKDKDYGPICKDIKVNPQNYNPKEVEKLIDELDKQLEIQFEKRGVNYKFDNDFANKLCLEMYFPILQEHHSKLIF